MEYREKRLKGKQENLKQKSTKDQRDPYKEIMSQESSDVFINPQTRGESNQKTQQQGYKQERISKMSQQNIKQKSMKDQTDPYKKIMSEESSDIRNKPQKRGESHSRTQQQAYKIDRSTLISQEDQKSTKNQKDQYQKIMSQESSDISNKLQKRGEFQSKTQNKGYKESYEDYEYKSRLDKYQYQTTQGQYQSDRNRQQPKDQQFQTKGKRDEQKKLHQQRGPATRDAQHNTGRCFNHGKPLSSFCETCEEPCCDECQSHEHSIISISEAYKKRMSQVYNMMNTHLFQKKEILIQQIRRRDQLTEEVRGAALVIEKDLRNEFEGMLERLNGQTGEKLALIQYDKDELQTDINKIQDIVMQIDSASSDHLQFIIKSKGIIENVESAIRKPYRSDINIPIDDLPKELLQTREMTQQLNIYKELNSIKNELI